MRGAFSGLMNQFTSGSGSAGGGFATPVHDTGFKQGTKESFPEEHPMAGSPRQKAMVFLNKIDSTLAGMDANDPEYDNVIALRNSVLGRMGDMSAAHQKAAKGGMANALKGEYGEIMTATEPAAKGSMIQPNVPFKAR